MTITEFLLARIAEDEKVARAVLAIYEPDEWDSPLSGGNHFPAEVTLWDRFDPARVLAECAAKRAIVKLHDYEWMGPDDAAGKGCEHDYEDWPCPTIRAIASVYADHSDYMQEWTP